MGIGTGAAVGGISSLIGGAVSASGANSAAQTQAQAAASAAQQARDNGQQAINYQNSQTATNTANQQPFLQAGQSAVQNLSTQQPFTAPNGVTEQNDPGYQFRLQQGEKALQNSAAARGGLLTGGTAKGIEDYAQGDASSEYGNVYNRALSAYQTNTGTQLALAGIGQNSANEQGQVGQAAAQNVGAVLSNETNQVNQQTNNAAAARASGYAGTANAITGAIPGIGNAVNQGFNFYNQPGIAAPTAVGLGGLGQGGVDPYGQYS